MTTFQPLEVVPGRVTVENDGDVPTTYGVEVSIGRSLPTGFQAETSRIFFSRNVQPRGTDVVQVPQTLPQSIAGGGKTVRVRLGTIGASGTLQRILSQEFFSGRFSVMLPPTELPLRDEVPAAPPAAAGLSPADITLQAVTAQPTTAERGDTVVLAIPVRMAAVPGLPGPTMNVQVTITVDGATVAQLPVQTFSLAPGQTNLLDVSWVVTPTAPEGSYGARIRLWDPSTLAQVGDLVVRNFSGLFQVGIPAVALPQPQQFADSLGRPSFRLDETLVTRGDDIEGSVIIPTDASFQFSPEIRLSVLDSSGLVVLALPPRSEIASPGQTISQRFLIDTVGLVPGAYGMRISMRDPVSNSTLLEPLDFPNLMQVLAAVTPAAPPVAPPEAPPTEALQLSLVRINPRRPARVGDTINFDVLVDSTGVASLRAAIVVLDTNGRVAPGGSLPEQSFTVMRGMTVIPNTSWNIPRTTAPGSYDLSVRVWDPTTLSTRGFLIDASGSNRIPNIFTVFGPAEAPALTAPAPTAAPAQLVPVGTGRISPTTVMGGTRVTGRWTVRNTGGQTGRASLDIDGPLVSERSVPQDVPAGQQVDLVVTGNIPIGSRLGRTTYGLALKDGRGVTVPNGVAVITLTVAPEAEPEEEEVAGILPGQLLMFPPTSQPTRVSPGQQVNLLLTVRNQSGIAGNIRVQAFPRDPNNRTRGTLDATVPVRATGTTDFTLSYLVPGDAAAGAWAVRVFLWDPRTFVPGQVSTFLLQQTFPGVFQVS